MMFVFSQLSSCTPDTVIQLIKDFAILIVLSTVGIAIFSIPIGRKFGMSTPMAFALGLGSIAGGFPASYTLSVEAAKVCAETRKSIRFWNSTCFLKAWLQVSSAQHPVLYSLQALLWQCSSNKRRFHHGFRFKR